MDLDRMITVPDEDGSVKVYVPIGQGMATELEAAGIKKVEGIEAASTWTEGTYYFPNTTYQETYFRLPKLSIPTAYYDQVMWSWEYYQQEPLINSLVDRDIAQIVTDEEFEIPEEDTPTLGALTEWSRTVNSSIGQHGGLREYNRALLLDLMISGLSVTLANWGGLEVDGKIYTVPKVLTNLNPLALIPDLDPFSGKRKYYYKISQDQYEAIRNRRKNAISEIIPDARSRLRTDLSEVSNRLDRLYPGTYVISTGYYLELPIEQCYVINYRARQQDRFPIPSLVPTFSAIAMKRKLQLADWSVADGMINMLMVWKFPTGTDPKKAKSVVQKFSQGGRVQSHAVPAGVEIQLITPDSSILNSSAKFQQPYAEILSHFDYIVNTNSGEDLDSPTADKSSNRARLDTWREIIEDHNTFFLRAMNERNKWGIDNIRATFQTRDLDDDENFRTFMQNAFDRGVLSYETYHRALKTSTEREAARRKSEKQQKLEDVFQIRPTFSQQVAGGTAGNGRPPDGTGPTAGNGPQAPRPKVS